MKPSKRPSRTNRLATLLYRGGGPLYLRFALYFLLILGLSVGLRLAVNLGLPDPKDSGAGQWGEALWRAVIETGNLAGLGKEELSGPLNRLVGVLTALAGGIGLLGLSAALSARFVATLLSLRAGEGPFEAQGHSVILGFGEQAVDVVNELVEANRFRKNPVILVVSQMEPKEALRILSEGIGDFANSQVVCKKADITSRHALRRLQVHRARSVVLINPARPFDDTATKHAADSTMQMAVMAVAACSSEAPPPMAVKMHFKRNLQLARNLSKGALSAFEEDEILAKILVQTSRQPGLSRVYADLAGFEGNETYFVDPPKRYLGRRFSELAFHFAEPIPLGLRSPDGTVELNPHPSYEIEPGDQLVVLAEDEKQLRWFDRPVIEPRFLPLSGKRAQRKPEHYLVFGWNRKTPLMLAEYDSYLPEGSVVNLVVPQVDEVLERRFKEAFEKHKNLQLGLGQVNANSPDFPAKLRPERYKAVVLLSGETDSPEVADAQTFSLLLKFRSYLKEYNEDHTKPAKTELLAEVQRSQSATLMQSAGMTNLMVSNRVLSKMLAQVAEEPEMLEVYEDLFRAEGSEIYLKSASLYLEETGQEVHFADLILAAQERGEICFGVRLHRMEASLDENLGLFLLPEKSQSFLINAEDQLVVLAPDET